MGTTTDKLNKLLETKAAIKAAIVEKGQPVTDEDTFASYEAKIKAIRTSDIQLTSIDVTKQPTKTSYTAKETFNPAGMEVKAIFSNDAAKFVDDFTVEPSGALKPTDTKATVKYTEFGVTAEADVAITVAAIKLNVPAQSGTPVYTGAALSPAWTGYDSSLMAISGNTSGVNAGAYTAKFSLKDKVNYTWADGTTADKSVAWSIGKAQASITLDKTSVVLNGDKLTETVNISSVGMNSIMAMSSDPSVATVALNGNVLTINSVDETTGEATIALSGTVDSNYNAPEYPSVEVSAEFAPPIVTTIFRPSSASAEYVYPSGMGQVEAISEEVSDGDATYIYSDVPQASGTSSPMQYSSYHVFFLQDGTNFGGTVTSGYIVIRRDGSPQSLSDGLNIAGTYFAVTAEAFDDGTGGSWSGYRFVLNDSMLARINDYIASNGKFPQIVHLCEIGGNNPGKGYTIKLTQAYLSLTYEGR